VKARSRFLSEALPAAPGALLGAWRCLGDDIAHLAMLSEPQHLEAEGWLSPMLQEGLRRAFSESPEVSELFHSLVLEPSSSSLLDFLRDRGAQIGELGRLAAEEEAHWKEAARALAAVKKAEWEPLFADFLEMNALLLFSTAFAEEEARNCICCLLGAGGGGEGASSPLLAELYQLIDQRRQEACAALFGPSSRVAALLKDYGLSKRGLC
jgi:hypothetical protein